MLKKIQQKLTSFFLFLKKSRRAQISVFLLFVFLLFSFFFFSKNEEGATEEIQEERSSAVTVKSVQELIENYSGGLTFAGEVRSKNRTELRSEKSGEITAVYRNVGTFVPAGTLIAEMDNSTEKAQVLQAKGSFQSALAQYEKIQRGARSEDREEVLKNVGSAESAYSLAKKTAENAYEQALSLIENALFVHGDIFFRNPQTVAPSFIIHTAIISEKEILEKKRVDIGDTLKKIKNNDSPSLEEKLSEMQFFIDDIQQFFTHIQKFVSEQDSSSEKNVQESSLLTARNALSSARGGIISSQNNLIQAQQRFETASLSLSKINEGEREEDIENARGMLESARGALLFAEANLEKTLFRTPFSGIITTLNVSRGDFISPQFTVAIISGDNVKEIESFVSEKTMQNITKGSVVTIEGVNEKGVVQSISPGLDPQTKKARVLISLPEDTKLTEGSFVSVTSESGQKNTVSSSMVPVPLSALKVIGNDLIILFVNENEREKKIASFSVPEGPFIGKVMLIPFEAFQELGEGKIVLDARGLKEGDIVEIK